MPFIDLDSVHFYQPPTKAGRPGDGGSTVLVTDVPTVAGEGEPPTFHEPSNEPSGRRRDYDHLIEVLDMTAPALRGVLSPFRELVPDLKDTEADTEDTSNEACIVYDHGYGREETEDLPSLEELLLGAGEMQDWQRAGSSGEHLMRRSDCLTDAIGADDAETSFHGVLQR
ncbi:MAG: hypothetical protein M1812_006225 [Candelaria pacifica]|nr:MAG: hypothetical protein M1812_006225 [Candelaria pacifica]